ncbi:hypothetical protein PSAC2689_140086 [Paraburkholderia sacchari]
MMSNANERTYRTLVLHLPDLLDGVAAPFHAGGESAIEGIHGALRLGLRVGLRVALVLTRPRAADHRAAHRANGRAFAGVARDRADHRTARRPASRAADPLTAADGRPGRWRRSRHLSGIDAGIALGPRVARALIVLLLGLTLALRRVGDRPGTREARRQQSRNNAYTDEAFHTQTHDASPALCQVERTMIGKKPALAVIAAGAYPAIPPRRPPCAESETPAAPQHGMAARPGQSDQSPIGASECASLRAPQRASGCLWNRGPDRSDQNAWRIPAATASRHPPKWGRLLKSLAHRLFRSGSGQYRERVQIRCKWQTPNGRTTRKCERQTGERRWQKNHRLTSRLRRSIQPPSIRNNGMPRSMASRR